MNWETLKTLPVSELIAWASTQSWAQSMANCFQDAEWHAEGDVWTHTQMVLTELPKLEVWTDLNREEQTILTFTALFHDAAKPLTTERDEQTGRVRSPKHAVKGEQLTRNTLRKLGCDFPTREQIARMVRFHGRPAFLLEKQNITEEVVKLSWLVNNKLLYLFAIADTRGRDTDSMSRPEENLHFWKLAAEDAGCYEQPYPFESAHARLTYMQSEKPNLNYMPHESFRCIVTLLAGLPGSGKDTWIQHHRPEQPVVALDAIRRELQMSPTENQGRVAQLAKERCRELLRNSQSFVFNATNTLRLTRSRWINLFLDYNARVEIVYLEPDLKTILAQNKNREAVVPQKVIENLAQKCEPPTLLECHELNVLTEP